MSMWDNFAAAKDQWIGGTLIDCGDGDPIAAVVAPVPEGGARTTIVDFEVTPDLFLVIGDEFNCGGARQYLYIAGESRYGDGFEVGGYGGHQFHFIKPAVRR